MLTNRYRYGRRGVGYPRLTVVLVITATTLSPGGSEQTSMYAKQEETGRCGEGSVGLVSSNTTVEDESAR